MKKITKLLALTLTLCFIIGSAPALAADIVDSGKCGENITWTFDSEGTLTVSGTGELNDDPWVDHTYETHKVVIEEGITSIGDEIFYGYTYASELELPESLTTIGAQSFYGFGHDNDDGFGTLRIPDSVTSVGLGAFSCCAERELIISNSLTELNYRTFCLNGRIKSVVIPEGVTFIGREAFDACYRMEKVELPSTLKVLGEYAFKDCDNLAQINIPDGITELRKKTFWNCVSLKRVILPDGLKTFEEGVFSNSGLVTLTVPDGVTTIERHLCFSCEDLKAVVLPASIIAINDWAFESCKSLTNIYFAGTKEQWEKITIDSTGNKPLFTAKIHFNSPWIWGDVNDSGFADAGDATMVLRATVGVGELTEDQLLIADMNASGTLDAGDATLILRDVVGA